ncbi:hypothetical protein [Chryseobacterium sp. NKUCC03_KSP]|uniref:hypothetical protein n=1 Tax=Chryseobacterium sp. NKUCC03_KSP TaxID=2842125 RepID=UPI001C5AA4EE|nr:hypothetical protein [Chryseobacterium sp. NKUCC03_KSP]MBW3524818.1 hypothetical protein [Chryseobacterium sp. NKUCC03_KSP]
MKKIIILLFIFKASLVFSQTKSEIEALVITIAKTENSKEIIKTGEIKIFSYMVKKLCQYYLFFSQTERLQMFIQIVQKGSFQKVKSQ